MKPSALFALAMFLLFGCISLPGAPPPSADGIGSFDECADAGYPVAESFPRVCRTPDGRSFESPEDRFQMDKDITCMADADCALVDSEYGFGCCYAGYCDEADYSEESFIAVNRAWLEGGKARHCPAASECGPAPGCPTRIIDAGYAARCVSGSCAKVDEHSACCNECRELFSISQTAISPNAARCGRFISSRPMSAECEAFFRGNPSTVSECPQGK